MTRPELSLVVVVHRMSRQAANTLHSLSTAYQRSVSSDDYEVIVVENRSGDLLGEAAALSAGPNFRYVLRDEPGVSPAPALNHGARVARAERLGLLVDGARLVTPRVVEYALLAGRMDPRSLVVVPGFHLGSEEQQRAPDHDAAREQALLASVGWPGDGYRLFEISVPSSANPHGPFHPFMESNCLFCAREDLERIGGVDERFDLPGGGSVNLWLYRRLALLPGTRLVVLPGEGSFHQAHGGVTTTAAPELPEVLQAHREQLARLLGHPFEAPRREPMLLGAVTSHAQTWLRRGAERAEARFARFCAEGRRAWGDDPDPTE